MTLRNFLLEEYFADWEFNAAHHMTASDVDSMTTSDLLELATPQDRYAFENAWLGYTEPKGALDLREVIANTYADLNADNILCFAGAAEGIYAAMRVLLSPGDHLIVPVPNYQSAESVADDICEVTGIGLNFEAAWRLDLQEVEDSIKSNTKLISINYPHNPDGMIMSKDDLFSLIEICRRNGLILFSDEVFRGVELNDEDRLPQVADIYERGISLGVMSKAYGLPGLRIGWLAAQNRELLDEISRYKHYLSITNSASSERLALIALKVRKKILKENQTYLRKNIEELESFFLSYPNLFKWLRPRGGCIAYPKFIGPGGGEKFCRDLLRKKGVFLLPGSVYESPLASTPPNHFRIGYGRKESFQNGLNAIGDFLDEEYSTSI